MYIRCTVPEFSPTFCCLKYGIKSIILTGGCITRKYRWQIRHRIRHRINEQTNRTDIMIHRSSARVRAPIIPLQVSKYLFIICLFDHLKHNTCRESEFELLKFRINLQYHSVMHNGFKVGKSTFFSQNDILKDFKSPITARIRSFNSSAVNHNQNTKVIVRLWLFICVDFCQATLGCN